MKRFFASTLTCGVLIFFHCTVSGHSRPTMGEQSNGSTLVPSNQTIAPIGHIEQIEGSRVKDVELSPDGRTLGVLTNSVLLLYTPEGRMIDHLAMTAGPLGLAWTPDSRTLFASGDKGQVYHVAETARNDWTAITSFVVDNLSSKPEADKSSAPSGDGESELRPDPDAKYLLKRFAKPSQSTGDPQVTGLAVAPDGKRLYIALSKRNAITVVDIATETVIARVPVGVAPFRIVVSHDNKTVFVANRGGRHPAQGDADVTNSAGTPLHIDPKTDAALRGSISFIDATNFRTTEMDEGRQPTGMVLSHDGNTLYVANSDEDTVTAVDVPTRRVRQSLSLQPSEDPGLGQLPTDLALGHDEKTLYITCGGGNAVALVSLPDFSLKGFLPTAWFPIAIAERDGKLFVGDSKGIGARARQWKGIFPIPSGRTLVHDGDFHVNGSISIVQFIGESDRSDVTGLTKQVAANNHWNTPELGPRPGIAPAPVPARVGEPSTFRHVVYIIKENHTYDFDFGDIAEGNGDKALCAFGENITPNEHALARQFVLLDNSYTSGTNSADGHQWTDSGMANAYIEQNYASYARSYPFNGTDPLAYSPNGFLWNAVMHAGKSVRVYGEFVGKAAITEAGRPVHPSWSQLWSDYKSGGHRFHITAATDNRALRPCLSPHYVGFPLTVSDQWRADQFLEDFATFEKQNSLPALSILLLPSNHTSGAVPGMPTPGAAVADNDLAFGRIVDRISHSRFWPDTLILVVEDDSLFALDHVDGHRMISFCISPYTRRGAVVSELYNHTSFVRTIGLVLGLPAMNRFDRTATPLTACFTSQPDLDPYNYVPSHVPLDDLNPPLTASHGKALQLAKASDRLDWSAPDRADPAIVARAAWADQKPTRPFPWSYFHPAVGGDDDD